ncbi:MAG: GerMN domain-containing protein [Pyrinomonadaceae bacterium]|nr:GerMN domain-containing protein [Pyrinomonadaceae bacterium]
MKRTTLLLIGFIICLSISIFGQKATKIEIKNDREDYLGGRLFVTVGGKARKISNTAVDAWIIDDGKAVVFAMPDRSRGFEGEGVSLSIYDVKTGKIRQIMAEHTFTTGLSEVRLSNGSIALVVSMGDGGLGGSYIAVVDPKRGEVLDEHLAELTEIKGDKITLAYYKEEDWDAINEAREWDTTKSQNAFAKPTKVNPEKTATFDLKEVLKNKVIYNPTNEEYGKEYERKYSNLIIYLWRPNDKVPDGKEYFLMRVGREFPKTFSPLKVALESLFAGATDYEKQTGWESAVFGMKFEGVVLRNGVATIKFSQPKVKNKKMGYAGKMFLEAVTGTATQFPTVKKVEICEVGGTGNAFDVTPQIPKCSSN